MTDAIKKLLEEINYNFDTIEYLLDFDRRKESLPILCRNFDLISEFKKILERNHGALVKELDGPLSPEFDKKTSACKTLNKEFFAAPDKTLDALQFTDFCKKNIRVWRKNAGKTRVYFAGSLERKIKKFSIYGAIAVFVFLTAFFIYDRIISSGRGLQGEFFWGQNFGAKIGVGLNRRINFENRFEMLKQGLPEIFFSARWSGKLLAPQDGTYQFFAVSDDGVRVTIDGQVIIDNWNLNASAERSGSIFLKKGAHTIQVEYFQWEGGVVLKLLWQYENHLKQIIPAKYFRPS